MSIASNHSDDDQFAPTADDQAEFAAWCQERLDAESADLEQYLDDMAELYATEAECVALADLHAGRAA